jgi:hypothetical protein
MQPNISPYARLIDEQGRVMAEIASDDTGIYFRARGARNWRQVHSGLNPTLAVYLQRCKNNFGWTVEYV